jgi:hypothetical protein
MLFRHILKLYTTIAIKPYCPIGWRHLGRNGIFLLSLFFISGNDMDFRHGSIGSRMSFVVLLAGTILVAMGSYFLSGHDMDFRRGYAKIQVYI